MNENTPKPPSHLSSEARAWFVQVCELYLLESHHLKLLQAAAEARDRAQLSRRTIKREGAFYTNRFGAPKAHPALDQERKARNDFRLLVRELGLDSAPATEVRAPGPPANANLRLHG